MIRVEVRGGGGCVGWCRGSRVEVWEVWGVREGVGAMVSGAAVYGGGSCEWL